MAVKFSELPEKVTAADADEVAIVDAATGLSKRVSVANFVEGNADVAANTAHTNGDGSDHADVATNTAHTDGDGSDHADVATNTAHTNGDGSDHADVATNTADIATNVTAIGLNTTHRGSSGVDHSNVVLNDTLRTTGWVAAGESWTSPSFADTNGESTLTMTVPTDATDKYSEGMRIKFTQDATVRYGIITKVAATVLTIFINTDYTPTGNAITLPYYSTMKVPFGFDADPSKWRVRVVDVTKRDDASPSGSWQRISGATDSITVPIGKWDLGYAVNAYVVSTAAQTSVEVVVTLSATVDSEDDNDMSCYSFLGGASAALTTITNCARKKTVDLSASDVYYLLADTSANADSLSWWNTAGSMILEANCAYL